MDRVKGQDKMATFLAAHPDQIGAVANNDDMALGAIEALKAQGYFTEGGGTSPCWALTPPPLARAAIKAKTMLYHLLNDAKNQAYATVELAGAAGRRQNAYRRQLQLHHHRWQICVDPLRSRGRHST